MLQLPGLVVPIFGVPGVEVSDGGEELGGVHGSTHPLPRTSSRARLSAIPSRTSLRIRCSCSTVADSPGVRSAERGVGAFTEVTEELKLFFPCSREDIFPGRL